MSDLEKFGEKAKAEVLYKQQNQDTLPRDILDQWPENTRYNGEMAVRLVILEGMISTWPAKYREGWDEIIQAIPTMYRGVDGWAVEKAIQAVGELREQKKGVLDGIFGGGSK